MIKYYGLDENETTNKISWQNLMMLNMIIPPSKTENTTGSGGKPTGQTMSFFELGQKLANGDGA